MSLSTFRRTGVAVSTPVWIARDGDALVVITPEESGKVKRLRNSGRVEMRPCSRRGAVEPDAATVTGEATFMPDSETARIAAIFRAKYGLEFPVVMAIEHLVARRRKKRVILRIVPG